MQLTGKHVLIAGGTSGLGLSVSKLLVDKGARVWAFGRSQESVEQAHAMLPASTYMPTQCDILNLLSLQQLAYSMEKIDVLINSAGVYLEGLLEENDPAQISKVIDTNLKGLIYTTQVVLPYMKKQNSGTVINISSTAGLKPKLQQSVYAASKYGVQGFTESLKLELLGKDIDVLGFYPGKMNTPLMQKSGFAKDTTGWMNPDEVAEIIVYMLERPSNMKMDKVVVKRRK